LQQYYLSPGYVWWKDRGVPNNLQVKSKDVFTKLDADELFDIKMITVSPEARGLGLANELVRRSIQLAKCLGYKGCKTEATSAYSRKAMLKGGLTEEVMVRYDTFSFKGERPFQGIQGHEGLAFMSMKL